MRLGVCVATSTHCKSFLSISQSLAHTHTHTLPSLLPPTPSHVTHLYAAGDTFDVTDCELMREVEKREPNIGS